LKDGNAQLILIKKWRESLKNQEVNVTYWYFSQWREGGF
jgi:hypothetical protein